MGGRVGKNKCGDARLRVRSVLGEGGCANGRRRPLGLLASSLALCRCRARRVACCSRCRKLSCSLVTKGALAVPAARQPAPPPLPGDRPTGTVGARRACAPLSRQAAPVLGVGELNTPRPLHRRCRAAEVGWTGTSARSSLLEAVCPLLCSAQLLLAPHPRARATKRRRCRRAAALPPPAPQSPPCRRCE